MATPMRSARYQQPSDVLVCPITGRKLWARPAWDGDGPAVEIHKVDEAWPCPACDGYGRVERPRRPRHGAQLEPESDAVTCDGCDGSGVVTAYFTISDSPDRAFDLLWPVNARDAERGLME